MNSKIRISQCLFNMALIIWIVMYVINQTYYSEILPMNNIMQIGRVVVYLLLFFKILVDKSYNIKVFLGIFILLIVFIITINSKIINILDTFLFVYSARNINVRMSIKKTYILHIILMVFILVSSFLGIITNDIWYRENNGIRYGLGYKYTTFSSNYFFHIVLMYIYLKNEKKFRVREFILIFIINYIFYYLTDTRAVFYLINFIILICYFINKKNKINKSIIKRNICIYCFPVAAILSIFVTINYNYLNPIYIIIDKILTGRLVLAKSAYETFGIKLFGQIIPWINGNVEQTDKIYNYVDSSYINILLNFGIVILILLCLAFIILGKETVKNNDYYLFIVLIALSIHSMTDPQLIELGYNSFLLLLSVVFFSKVNIKIRI